MPATLAEPRIQRFLGTKDVVVLATVQHDGAPLAMPMWFLPDAESLVMISVADTQKVRNLRRDPRVCVVAESVSASGAICGVTVQGRAEFLDDGPERQALIARLLAKYDPRLERLWGGRAMPPNRVLFRIVPVSVRDWGLA
jgi:PPOX class probable F420-dependent enzyme